MTSFAQLRTTSKNQKCLSLFPGCADSESAPNSLMLYRKASLDRSVKLWDSRSLGAGTGERKTGGMRPILTVPHFRSVNSAHFSPRGEWVVTVGQDDKLKLFKDLSQASGPQVCVSWCDAMPAVTSGGFCHGSPGGVHGCGARSNMWFW